MAMQLEYVRHFKDLEVYKRQRELSREVFRLSKRFPTEEKFSLTDQLRRASRSIGAQIAEAWAKRLYPKHFVSKFSDTLHEEPPPYLVNDALDFEPRIVSTHQ